MVKSVAGSLLGSIDLHRDRPDYLHTQLYNALRELILDGALQSEERLPSTRVLARELIISRTTVLTVYDRLSSEGLLYSRTGAGSFVSGTLRQRQRTLDDAVASNSASNPESPPLSSSFTAMFKRLPNRVDVSDPQAFSTAIPAIDVFPMDLWSRLVSRYSRRTDLIGYHPSKGYPPLRNAIAAHLRTERGLDCSPDQIFITGGAQQALYFLGEILLNPGDTVWFEDPGSRVARNSFSARGARLVPVPVDDDGMIVSQAVQDAPAFKLASVTPSHQQPRGSIMSLPRRLELLNAADKANAWIIEDDFDGEFFYSKRPLPTLFSVDRNKRVIYVGTFSKSMFPSLRLGYFVMPKSFVGRLDRSVGGYLPAVPLLLQASMAEFIEKGHFAAHIRRAKRAYRDRFSALSEAIRQHLDDYLILIPTETGFHAMALFKTRVNEQLLAEKAHLANILVRPLRNYRIDQTAQGGGIVLGFGCVTPDEIRAAVIRLRTVFDDVAGLQRA